MVRIISAVSTPGFDTPRKTSASTSASAMDARWRVVANSRFSAVRSFRSAETIPWLSLRTIFSRLSPSSKNMCTAAMAAAPAPLTTTRSDLRSLPVQYAALIMAAEMIMAVPCWSSCMTGMSSASTRRRSISKHSGALISSRLMPPNVGAMRRTHSTNWSGVEASTSISNASMPAIALKRRHLPSITGFAAKGPMFPRPRTAVPLLMTATRFPRPVYS